MSLFQVLLLVVLAGAAYAIARGTDRIVEAIRRLQK
jgi:hypothetical protein